MDEAKLYVNYRRQVKRVGDCIEKYKRIVRYYDLDHKTEIEASRTTVNGSYPYASSRTYGLGTDTRHGPTPSRRTMGKRGEGRTQCRRILHKPESEEPGKEVGRHSQERINAKLM
jgi:hypothetical protein